MEQVEKRQRLNRQLDAFEEAYSAMRASARNIYGDTIDRRGIMRRLILAVRIRNVPQRTSMSVRNQRYCTAYLLDRYQHALVLLVGFDRGEDYKEYHITAPGSVDDITPLAVKIVRAAERLDAQQVRRRKRG